MLGGLQESVIGQIVLFIESKWEVWELWYWMLVVKTNSEELRGYISASQALISTVGESSTRVQFTPIQAKKALRST